MKWYLLLLIAVIAPAGCLNGEDTTQTPPTFSVGDPVPGEFVDYVDEDGTFVALRSSVQNVTSNATVVQYKSSQIDFPIEYHDITENTFIALKCTENDQLVFDEITIERVYFGEIPHEAYKFEADTGDYILSGSAFFICETDNCVTNVLFQGPAVSLAEDSTEVTLSIYMSFSEIERDARIDCSVAFQAFEPPQAFEKTFSFQFINDRPPHISAAACDAQTPCANPEHICISFPELGPRCASPNPCDYYVCDEGHACVMAESFPPQVMCQ